MLLIGKYVILKRHLVHVAFSKAGISRLFCKEYERYPNFLVDGCLTAALNDAIYHVDNNITRCYPFITQDRVACIAMGCAVKR